MSDEEPQTTLPSVEDIRKGLLEQYDKITNVEDKAKLFQVIAERADAQSKEKAALQKEVTELTEQREAQKKTEFESFADKFQLLMQKIMNDGENYDDTSTPPKMNTLDDLISQLPTWTAQLQNAIGNVTELATNLDSNIDDSRKRRRETEQTPARGVKAKTNEEIIRSFIV